MVVNVRIQERGKIFPDSVPKRFASEVGFVLPFNKGSLMFRRERGERGCFHSGCQGLGLGRFLK